MKKSFMNIKNFVDSNVRQRIDRATHHSTDVGSDDLLLAERHFDDIRQVCIDAEKRISALLQSIQTSTNPSHIGVYTQNVQAGLNNLSHNIGLSTSTSVASNAPSVGISKALDTNPKLQHSHSVANSPTPKIIPRAQGCVTDFQQYNSSESLCNENNLCSSSQQAPTPQPPSSPICHSQEQLSTEVQLRHKKLPIIGFYKFLVKSSDRLRQESLIATTLSQCSKLQIQLTNLYLSYEQIIETQCLKPIQQILESDIPNIIKLKKLYVKAHNDHEFLKSRYNGACLKQQQQQNLQTGHFSNASYLITQGSNQQSNTNKLDQLKNELDESITRFEQSKDNYEAELYGFLCREIELSNLLMTFYQSQAQYHHQVANVLQGLLPALGNTLTSTPRKLAFGTKLDDHLRCTGRTISPVIELCTHFLHLQGLREEGLFRIPGSSIKIRKLRNAIDAWFVSLANIVDLENDSARQSGHSCINALYEFFRNTVSQSNSLCDPQTQHQASTVTASSLLKSSLAADEYVLNQTNFAPSQTDEDGAIILDVHTVAGLLKLYLRELPEPLFTNDLYERWVDSVSDKITSREQRLDHLKCVIDKLPSSNHANLMHLIKFLKIVSQHQDHNKMTSTNLAIAMAPSLIWCKPSASDSTTDSANQGQQSLNIQISSFGASASLHAALLEALINNADVLFPDSTDFTLPGFANLKLNSSGCRQSQRSRSLKSTSPTGLSTASSSSFSSSASNSTSPSTMKGHNRKGGSMEGLLGGQEIDKALHQPHRSSSIRNPGRPISVQIQRDHYNSSVAGPVKSNDHKSTHAQVLNPRSQTRQSSVESTCLAKLNSTHKPPAPPVPPPTSIRHQQERLKVAQNSQNVSSDNSRPQPASLRGTGTINPPTVSGSTSSVASLNTQRPTVPPPERPNQSSSDSRDSARQAEFQSDKSREFEPEASYDLVTSEASSVVSQL